MCHDDGRPRDGAIVVVMVAMVIKENGGGGFMVCMVMRFRPNLRPSHPHHLG